MTIKDKVVVITGASSGIGEATAKILAAKGAKVILGARREDKLQEIAKAIGPNASYQVTDVTKKADVKALLDLAVTRYGRLDVLFNNAGIMPREKLADAKYDNWEKELQVNVMGVLYGIGAALPIMQQHDGLIITTDSVAGHVVYPESAVYNGTKYAVRAIMEGLRQEERLHGIRSTIVSPGSVSTELAKTVDNPVIQEEMAKVFQQSTPEQRRMTALDPEDIANAVAYVVDQPKHVAISDMLIRPTAQAV
ncbi:SDR family oxidoreductase [Schleiferilactobacillus harbinensis]|uniref:SDR family NAD(P)-dependent oxidoreductase n=1 Tax=Schleiferilactobacillus harbinensis TaxID=304207 RepID=A0A5P8M9J4_9LACO|nr:SDR family oxidoreductase [Schleiferilactobacillus harbinensis]QFR25163.1 SDR family NAD(P)-dependent oxidoreductase [Schleiferilactobacillus harbinensis]